VLVISGVTTSNDVISLKEINQILQWTVRELQLYVHVYDYIHYILVAYYGY